MQYLIFAAGYDSFAYRQPDWASRLQIFELDYPLMSIEKQVDDLTFLPIDLTVTGIDNSRFTHTDFDISNISFCSLLGSSYYLTKENFQT